MTRQTVIVVDNADHFTLERDGDQVTVRGTTTGPEAIATLRRLVDELEAVPA